jgi:HlyD family secretion protein
VCAAVLSALAFPRACGGEQERRSLAVVAAEGLLSGRVTVTGRVVALRAARISARLSGHVAAWGQNADGRPLDVGDFVKAGQELFRLDTSTFEDRRRVAEAALKLAQALLADLRAGEREERREALRATVAELDARMAENKRDEERFTRLVKEDKTMPVKRLEEIQTQRQVLEAQRRGALARLRESEAGPTATQVAAALAQVAQAQAQLDSVLLDLKDTVCRAPYDGVIFRRFKTLGDYLATPPVTEVLELVSAHDLEAELHLPERYYAQVAPGQTQVVLRSVLLPAPLRLPVARVIPGIDPVQGTFACRVAIPAGQLGGLVPGLFLQADLALDGTAEGVVVPLRALVTRDGKPFVFVAEAGRMKAREVELGDRLTEGVIVRRGLKAGEKVVVGSDEDLKDGAVAPGAGQ